MMIRRHLPRLMMPLIISALCACHHRERNYSAAPLIVPRLPSANELNDIPLDETEDQTRRRFGTPYWGSEDNGEKTEQYSVALEAAQRENAPQEAQHPTSWPKPTMTVRACYRRDKAGVWRTTNLHWWQEGSTRKETNGWLSGETLPEALEPHGVKKATAHPPAR